MSAAAPQSSAHADAPSPPQATADAAPTGHGMARDNGGFHVIRRNGKVTDFDAGKIDSEVSGQAENEFELTQVIFAVHACISIAPRGFEEPFPLVQSQRLGMDIEHLGDSADVIEFFRSFPLTHLNEPLIYLADFLEKYPGVFSSVRGSFRFRREGERCRLPLADLL